MVSVILSFSSLFFFVLLAGFFSSSLLFPSLQATSNQKHLQTLQSTRKRWIWRGECHCRQAAAVSDGAAVVVKAFVPESETAIFPSLEMRR